MLPSKSTFINLCGGGGLKSDVMISFFAFCFVSVDNMFDMFSLYAFHYFLLYKSSKTSKIKVKKTNYHLILQVLTVCFLIGEKIKKNKRPCK